MSGRTSRQPKIGILCLSAIPDDPRVRRQGDLLRGAGWDVVAIGLPGSRSPEPAWQSLAIDRGDPVEAPVHAATTRAGSAAVRRVRQAFAEPSYREEPAPRRLATRALMTFARRSRRVFDLLRLTWTPDYALTLYWRLNDDFERIYRLARQQRVDLWLANDWTMLPIARRLARDQAAPFGYDTHELAIEEYVHNRRWRFAQRPIIAEIERKGVKGAAFITCVSEGIADRMKAVHDLANRPTVVRNMPFYQAHNFRPTGERIALLYHGVVTRGRAIEACIRAMALCRSEFTLTVRGQASPHYRQSLEELVRKLQLDKRVCLEDPVPMTELIARAAEFDVGLFALPDYSAQNVYVLPNKFFEYTMAGLALCVSDLPEMRRLLRAYELGMLIAKAEPASIAAAVNELDRASIDRFKRNALEAARDLNWETEGRKFLALCDRALAAPPKHK